MRSPLLACGLLWLAGVLGCGSGTAGELALPVAVDGGGAPGDQDAGTHSPPLPAQDAGSRADAGAQMLPMPVADGPCNEDIAFIGGQVQPDVGQRGVVDETAVDLEKAGKFSVYESDVKVPITAATFSAAGYDISIEAGELSGTLYAPSDDGSSVAKGPFPLLMVLPGFQASYTMYESFSTHFASHGFMVLGVDTRSNANTASHDKEALELTQAITWALSQSPVMANIDSTKIATTGHSKGGKVSFFAAAIDARIDLAFGWDPSNAGGPPCFINAMQCDNMPVAPNCGADMLDIVQPEGIMQYTHAETFVFGVPPDGLVNPEQKHNAINFYRGAPSPANLVYFDDGHIAWLAPPAGNTDVVRITKAVQTAKLLVNFYGAKGLDRYLPDNGEYLEAQGKKVKQFATK